MRMVRTEIPDVFLFEPTVHYDERGFFFESYNGRCFAELTGKQAPTFVQENASRSKKGVLRGLHYQVGRPQAKIVQVVAGEVFDVCVDIRRSSPTFGKWVGVHLSAENKRQIWIPEGFAHGFLTLSETADSIYKTTEYWVPELERVIAWNDPHIAVKWPLHADPLLSAKDAAGLRLANAEIFA
jgi:dTDP-4-dehydrorhamnose 3,5-epimerase